VIFKEDWGKCKERFDAFWEGEIIDRCVISVTSPRNKPLDMGSENKEAKSLAEKWLDCDYRYNQAIHNFSQTFFGGEAFPNFQINLGPGVLAAFMGATFTLHEDTVWFSHPPLLSDWNSLLKVDFDVNSEMWKIAYEIADFFIKRANGEYMVCNTDLGGTLDIAASFRSTGQLLMDLYDYPEEIKAFRDKIDDVWLKCYGRIQELVNKYQDGSSDWYPTWCREKRSYAIQCDFAAMISPAQFEDFAQPSLIRQSEALDRVIYHWDGPGQISHLDHLLDIESINGIQWCPGDGQPGGCDERWYPLYKRIQEKGKKLIITYVDPAKIEKLLDNISPEGVFLSGVRCDTEDEARRLIKMVEKWSAKKS
jgi:hypothetical protein